MLVQQSKAKAANAEVSYKAVKVTEGTVSSTTLLTGQVKALQEQYVYFDSSKGSSAKATVAVGDQITTGQQLVQYDSTTAQATYDTAVRALNKVGRQIDHLKNMVIFQQHQQRLMTKLVKKRQLLNNQLLNKQQITINNYKT